MFLFENLTNETTGDGKFQIVVFRKQRNNPAVNGPALNLALLILAHNTRPNLNLVSKLEHTSQDTTTSDTTLELLNLGTRLVDVKGPNDNHVRCGSKVANGYGNLGDEVLVDGVNVEFELRGNGNNGAAIGDCAADEAQNRLVVLRGGLFAHQVDLVLQDDNVV